MEADQPCNKRVRDDSDESEYERDSSPEVKRLRLDLLDSIEDSDPAAPSSDLDSVMKSFAEEIVSDIFLPCGNQAEQTGESQPDLGYLFEASDEQLGLPPSMSPTAAEAKPYQPESVSGTFDSADIGEFWGFGDDLPYLESFRLGSGEDNEITNGFADGSNENGEYVALDGLFDCWDSGFGPSDLQWRPETLPAQ